MKILLIGDYSETVTAHRAIPKALALAAEKECVRIDPRWLATERIASSQLIASEQPRAIWCVPGSPYRNMDGALTAIRFARENKIPFLGTCGGFQHALIEYARNVLNLPDAEHAESNPNAATPLISKLACSLVEQCEKIRLKSNSALHRIYGTSEVTERYHCSYGVNPYMIQRFQNSHLEFSGFSAADDSIRAFELTEHPFFVGVLFQPERSAFSGQSHPLISAFVKAACSING
jgi:CTP synthase (UTP-ammonia lyase)